MAHSAPAATSIGPASATTAASHSWANVLAAMSALPNKGRPATGEILDLQKHTSDEIPGTTISINGATVTMMCACGRTWQRIVRIAMWTLVVRDAIGEPSDGSDGARGGTVGGRDQGVARPAAGTDRSFRAWSWPTSALR